MSAPIQPRVLFVSHEASRTGAPMFLLHFLRWLRRHAAVDFEIFLGKGGPLEAEFGELGRILHRTDFPPGSNALPHFDLIYANTCFCGELINTAGCGHTPVITHLHELDCGYDWSGAHRLAHTLRHTSRFVACAQAVAKGFAHRFDLSADSIPVHYEMIDATRARQQAAARDEVALRQRFGLPADAFIVMGCGTVDQRKGVDQFLQAARHLKQKVGASRAVRFVWIGANRDPSLRSSLRHDAERMGLGSELVFTGELAEPHALLSLGNVFWLTSREDPFPLAMLEAAALQLPVLCFDQAGGAPEFCALGGGRAVPFLDPVALADETLGLMQAPEQARALGARAAALVDERFNVDAIAPLLWTDLQQWLHAPPDATVTSRQRSRSLTEIMAAWSPEKAPHPEFVSAHLKRQQSRAQAQSLVQQGRKVQALQILTQAAKDASAAGDAWIFCDGLSQIGRDLRTLDPNNSRRLLDNAAQVAARLEVDPGSFSSAPPTNGFAQGRPRATA